MQLIHKVLAVHHDLALGKGTIVQQRGLLTGTEQQIELATFDFSTLPTSKAGLPVSSLWRKGNKLRVVL